MSIEATLEAAPAHSRRWWSTPLAWLSHREADLKFAPPVWLAGLSVLTVLGAYVFVAWTTEGPIFSPDEVGMVGAAQVIANGTTGWTLAGSGYMPGLAVLLAPAWWFTDNSFLVYHIGLAIGVALSVATVWPLSLIARRVGIASRPGAVVIASVVMLFPARTLPANYLLAESLLTLLTATTFVVAYALDRQATARNSALLGALAGLAFLSHGRAVALLVAAGIWMLIVAGKRWRLTLAFLASSGLVSLGSWALYTYMTSQLYWRDERLKNTFDRFLSDTPADFLGSLAGSAWYAMAAWPALAVVGAFFVIKRGRRLNSPELLLGLALVTSVALSFVQLTPGYNWTVPRLDLWIYGRYIDHLLTVLAVIGLAVLVRVRLRALPVAVLGASAAVGAAFMLFAVPRLPVGGLWVDAHVAGISHYLSEANYLDGQPEPWALLTLASVAIGTLLAVLGWMRFVLPVVAILALTLTVVTDATRVDPRNDRTRISEEINDPHAVVPQDEAIAFSIDYGLRINFFAFAANPRRLVPVTLEEASEEYSAFYTGYQDETPAEYGAKKLASPFIYYYTSLWIFPGPLFDELDAQGLLLEPSDE
ncbi:hypothetical protein [Demequina sp.]|uniref:hypothetical protein n=1 Tax=Demequina sp. TaxID=2050685 RepID=UPI0025C4439B|nr:hypothetical protein [Demequina sp.]